jgi:tRNA-2-methylthio-N6-dimethylallyladenosine synthase
MRRGYTREKYLDLVAEARKNIPNLRLTTDIIVGFPTEKTGDFKDTLDLMEEVRFGMAYIFKYSPRPGTEASKMHDDVPEKAKKERHKIVLDLQRNISKRKSHEKTTCSCRS